MRNIRTISDQDLMAKCQEFGKKAREWKNRFVALLPEVSRRGLHRKKGFATVVEFAAKVGGVGKRTVEEIFRVERVLADKPKLKAMVAEVGVNKVRVVASIATKENERELVSLVQTMSKPALELFARDARGKGLSDRQNMGLLKMSDNEIPPGRDLTRERMSFSVDGNIALEMRKIKLQMEKERKGAVEWNDVMCEMVKVMGGGRAQVERREKLRKTVEKKKQRSKREKMEKEQENVGEKPKKDEQKEMTLLKTNDISVAKKEIVNKKIRPGTGEEPRYIIAKKRHDLDDKYHGKCGVEGCNKPATEIHHVDGFAQVRNHDNIIPLCHEHHELKHYEMPDSPWRANEIVAMRGIACGERGTHNSLRGNEIIAMRE